jgi:hypothetical protein
MTTTGGTRKAAKKPAPPKKAGPRKPAPRKLAPKKATAARKSAATREAETTSRTPASRDPFAPRSTRVRRESPAPRAWLPSVEETSIDEELTPAEEPMLDLAAPPKGARVDVKRRAAGIACLVAGGFFLVGILRGLVILLDGTSVYGVSYAIGSMLPSILLLTAGVWFVRKSAVPDAPRSARRWIGVAILAGLTLLSGLVGLVALFGTNVAEEDVVPRYVRKEIGVTGKGPGFSATFPQTPELDSFDRSDGGQTLTFHELTDRAGKDSAFTVLYVDYPPAVHLQPRLILRTVAEEAATAFEDGEVLDFKQTTFGDDPAAGLRVSGGGLTARARLILHDRRLYVIQVVSKDDTVPGFTRFVNSFRLD